MTNLESILKSRHYFANKGPYSQSYGSSSSHVWMWVVADQSQSSPTLCDPWTAAHQASLSITNSQSLLKLMSIESVMPSNHLILSHPLLLPSVFPSIRVFSSESVLHIRWPKYWSFSPNPSSEHSGLTFFRMDWLDLLAVQGTLKSLLQHHSSEASVPRETLAPQTHHLPTYPPIIYLSPVCLFVFYTHYKCVT